MKVVVDCLAYQHRKSLGYERYIVALLDCLYDNVHAIQSDDVLVAVRETERDRLARYAAKLHIVPFGVKNVTDLFLVQNTFRWRLGLDDNSVILHTYNYGSLIKQARHILVIHDVQFRRFPQYWPKVKLIQRRISVPRSIDVATSVVTDSQFTKNELIRLYSVRPEKLQVIYLECDRERLRPLRRGGAGGPPGWDLSEGYFLNVSSLAPHKNTLSLLQAFRRFLSLGKPMKLVLVGSRASLGAECSEFITQSGIASYVVITGDISDQTLASLYEHCQAFIFPTQYEGFGYPIVEALSFDRPTFLSDIEICHEIGGVYARYFRPDDFDGLASLMADVVRTPAAFTIHAKDEIASRFSRNATTLRYIDLINRVAAAAPSRC